MSILIRFVQRIEWKKKNFSPLVFFICAYISWVFECKHFFLCKVLEMDEKELKGNIQMFDIKNHILWFFFCIFRSFPFFSLNYSIWFHTFWNNKKTHDFPCFSVIILFLVQYFCVEKNWVLTEHTRKKRTQQQQYYEICLKKTVLWPLIFEK